MKDRKAFAMKCLIAAIILAIVLIVKFVFGAGFNSGTRIGFAGNSTFHKYAGSYVSISGTFSHTLFPSKGASAVLCEIKTESGDLTVTVTDQKTKEVIFEKTFSGDETFEVPAEGKVNITLTTKKHKGSYSFTY
jgi:hypothetical protein